MLMSFSVCLQDEQEKIDALEWLVFDPMQRSAALRQANALMRSFLSEYHVLSFVL